MSKAKLAKIDPNTCSHPLISRHIDKTQGGFSGNWVCQRCKQEFSDLVPAVTVKDARNCTDYAWCNGPLIPYYPWRVVTSHDE